MAKDIRFETPLMWIDKAETRALADYWGQLDLVREETLTCYNGIKGDGCGHCAACNLRANGLNHYLSNKAAVMAAMKQNRVKVIVLPDGGTCTLSGTAIFTMVNIAKPDKFNAIRQRGVIAPSVPAFTQFAFQRQRFCVLNQYKQT